MEPDVEPVRRAVLGQPRPGVDPAPRPEPDAGHPCGPFKHGPPSPPPIRTSKPFQTPEQKAKDQKSNVAFDYGFSIYVKTV